MRTFSSVHCVGLDCHRTFSRATLRDGGRSIVSRLRIEHADREKMREVLGSLPPGTPVTLEATFGWSWMCDELSATGLDPHLASSTKVAGWRNARGLPKTNRRDADLLSELWFEGRSQDRWWEVWLAPSEVRARREWLRFRMQLVCLQTQLKNRVHAILHRHGILNAHSDLFGVQGRRFLNGLADPKDPRLPDSAHAVLKGLLVMLDQTRRQIAMVTRQFRRELAKVPEASRLRTLPGVSWVLAYTIWAEVGDFSRFRSGRHLASYCLLAPIANESGEEHTDTPPVRHVGRLGRRTLKWAFIEAARTAIRGGGRMRAIYDARTDGGKRDRNRGCIAVARALCMTSWSMQKHGTDYCETPPIRPGSDKELLLGKKRERLRRKRRTSRPVKGQPDVAMGPGVSRRRQSSL